MRPKIIFIGHSYHIVTKSSEFFIDQLKLIGDVATEFEDCCKGEVEKDYRPVIKAFDMVVVWQLPQVIKQLATSGHRNLIFVPMYDAVHKLGAEFWQSLEHIKIICFSGALQAICLTHELDSFFIQYYPEWVDFSPAGYSAKSLFFWQRRSWPNWQAVTSILPASQFEKMHHHVVIDPGYEIPPGKSIGPNPSEMSDGWVSSSVWFDDKGKLLEKLREFNVFFLPRKWEGIGLSFLDAMKMGMIPVGVNSATFNEYVVDGVNGFIVSEKTAYLLPDLHALAKASKHYFMKGRANYLRSLEELGTFMLRSTGSPAVKRPLLLRKGPRFLRRWTNRFFASALTERKRTRSDTPLISVIVTVGNDIDGFLETHRSICGQSFKDIEYIVVDRHSTDGTREWIWRNQESIDHLMEWPDKDRNTAMRRAVVLSRGRYVLAFDAGDVFARESALEDALHGAPPDADIIYGHSYAGKEGGCVELRLAKKVGECSRAIPCDGSASPLKMRFPFKQSTLLSRNLAAAMPTGSNSFREYLVASCLHGAKSYHTNTILARLRL